MKCGSCNFEHDSEAIVRRHGLAFHYQGQTQATVR
jgi:hypothetical protein